VMGLTLHNSLLSEFRKSNPGRLASATLILALCLTTALVPTSLAQRAAKSERKVIVITKPDYPDILRRAQVGGIVRLKATVLPNGTVTDVEILGGNPILAENAASAVKKWKYAPAAAQTTEDISLSFSPH
jgi:TonB family protein